MHQDRVVRVAAIGLVGLLAFAPLVRGGHEAWAALMVAAGMLSCLALAVIHAMWRRPSLFVWHPQDLWLLVGLAWVWSGLHRPAAPPDARIAFLILVGGVAAFALARCLSSAGWALRIAHRLVVIGGLVSVAGLLQLAGWLGHEWWRPPQFVAATFVNHNHFAAYLELLLPLGCAVWLQAPLKPSQRFLVGVSSSLMAIGLIVSCSRGAWVSLAVAAAAGLGWLWTRRARVVWTWQTGLIIVAAVGAIGFLISQPPILARGMSLLDAPNDPSLQMRLSMWQGTWDLVKEHPFIGHGVGSFVFEFPRHRPADLYRLIDYAHNEYLQLVSELGLVGLTLAILIAVLVIRRMARLMQLSQTPWKRALGLGGLVGLTSVALHSVLDFPWHIPAVAYAAAAVAGLVTGVGYHADPRPLRTFEVPGTTGLRGIGRWALGCLVVAGLGLTLTPISRLALADFWVDRGATLRRSGQVDQAVLAFQRAGSIAPLHESHRQLGESLRQLAWQHPPAERRLLLRRAAEAYRQSLTSVPHDAWSAHALGEVLKESGHVADADRWLTQAVASDPNNPLYWKHRAELKLIRGEGSEAAEAFRRAAHLAKPHGFFPSLFDELDDPDHFVRAGESALLLGRWGIAKAAFMVARQFNPAHSGATVGLALCAFSRGDADTAQHLMASVHAPALRAKWHAGLAHYHLNRGRMAEAQASLQTSLALDPSNVLARHLELLVVRGRGDGVRYAEAVDQLLSLNRPPVFVRTGEAHGPLVVWEPEQGSYGQGHRTKTGWAFSSDGAIHQQLVVPPGKVRVTVTASGTKAGGMGPTLALRWNGRPVLATEVKSETSAAYGIETEVRPGESLVTIAFVDDLNDLLAREDRHLTVDHVVVAWESL